ncbi:MAG: helix-turn-helix transcriptional regulator [Pseudomonadota bacterium]
MRVVASATLSDAMPSEAPDLIPPPAKQAVENIDLALGQTLRLLRVQGGRTQSEVAEHLDISPQQYQKYEKGSSRCSLVTIYRLAEYFDVSVGDLLPAVGQHVQGFSEGPQTPLAPPPTADLSDETEALSELLRIIVRIPSKPMRQRVLRLLNEAVDPS